MIVSSTAFHGGSLHYGRNGIDLELRHRNDIDSELGGYLDGRKCRVHFDLVPYSPQDDATPDNDAK